MTAYDTTTSRDVVLVAAERLLDARASVTPCAPVRDVLGAADVDAAYAVQELVLERRTAAGRRLVGRKIGLTTPAVQAQLGVDQPDFGPILDTMVRADGEHVHRAEFLQPRVEGEVAFVLGADLDDPHSTVVDVLRATDFLLPAIEIVDSRIAGWDIAITDTIADDASSGAVVLGTTPVSPRGLDLTEVALALEHDGELVSSGVGAACLGSPARAVTWLARESARRGRPLRAGEVVLSGALGPMADLTRPGRYRAELSGLGHVELLLVDDGPSHREATQ
ncbi:2-keto-4-pentenoate hydratase [Pseudonocardia sp. CA-142604]|uniref:2-keto-4-pentenoate hydratase n=1 Tax=Pseudonocardia sp. CA-142604 TaxID=3240024 RepID=UPI003D8DB1CA